ncbi:MAG: GIY-YIG nuclease family protein [Halomonas sp.]|uniref:GIY-YIG nuclease family protein n=1 Tax=Halomonas sp. TaxID=1486246 RepID=UPI003F90E402
MIEYHRKRPHKRTLEDIFSEDDDLGLLNVKPSSRAVAGSQEQRLLTSFHAIEDYVTQHGTEPSIDDADLAVASLARSLAAFRRRPEDKAILAKHDSLGLLEDTLPVDSDTDTATAATDADHVSDSSTAASAELATSAPAIDPEAVTSLEDIWASDDMGLLTNDDESASIFDITNVPEISNRDMPDDIAQRTHCDDFFRFESLFDEVRQEVRSGEAEAVPFQMESQIAEGDIFILNGMLCIADQVGEESVGAGAKFNPRLRVVYDNGTESNLLLRSLARALYKDDMGRRILRRDSTFDAMQGLTHHDKRTGVIYILRSLSDAPALRGIRHLHKIGYTEKSLSSRLAGAEKQQTYLEAPVRVAASFDCYNLDPRRFERLVHAMLHHQRVNVVLRDNSGNTYRPKEWFDVELDTAREVVKRIVDGTIVQYRMDNTVGRLVRKK